VKIKMHRIYLLARALPQIPLAELNMLSQTPKSANLLEKETSCPYSTLHSMLA